MLLSIYVFSGNICRVLLVLSDTICDFRVDLYVTDDIECLS